MTKWCAGSGDVLAYNRTLYRQVEEPTGRAGEYYFLEGKGRRVTCVVCGRELKVTTAGLTGSGAVPRHKRAEAVG